MSWFLASEKLFLPVEKYIWLELFVSRVNGFEINGFYCYIRNSKTVNNFVCYFAAQNLAQYCLEGNALLALIFLLVKGQKFC